MKTLYDEVELNNLKLKNRIIRSATWEALANSDGSPSNEQIEIYENLAKGGVGGIITGFTIIDDNDIYLERPTSLSNDTLIEKWKELIDKVHSYNCPIIAQLAIGAYIHNGEVFEADNCTIGEINNIINLFVEASKRAEKAGFDGVQIHIAHNFYLSRFISPAFNHRTDEYGKNQEGRSKIVIDMVKKIKKEVLNLHISSKINGSDFLEGGLTIDDFLITAELLYQAGLDSIEISGNGTSLTKIKPHVNEAYFLNFAKELQKISSIPIILVGGHRSIDNIENILNHENIPLFSMSRPLIMEPDLINRWKSDKSPSNCISCNRCYSTPAHQCVFNINK